jgi:hypothetical protein
MLEGKITVDNEHCVIRQPLAESGVIRISLGTAMWVSVDAVQAVMAVVV